MDAAALLDFVLTAEHGGFGAASRSTGRSKATLARRVAGLEDSLGVRLFERGGAGLRLTEAGQDLLTRISGPFGAIRDATEAVHRGGDDLQGPLRISAAVVFAHAHLVRIAAAFCRAHPAVEMEIVADDEVVDLVADSFDIVIRANPAADERWVGKRIARTDRVAVAAPEHPTPDEGEAAALIYRSAEHPAPAWRLVSESGPRSVLLRPAMKLSTLLMMRKAAIHGAGAALLPRTLVEDDLAAGRLTCWGVEAGGETEIWALHASRRLPSAKVTAFLRHLEEALSRT